MSELQNYSPGVLYFLGYFAMPLLPGNYVTGNDLSMSENRSLSKQVSAESNTFVKKEEDNNTFYAYGARPENNDKILKAVEGLITIEGTGYAVPNGNHPLTKVTVLEVLPSSGDTVKLDSVFTDATGGYKVEFLMTDVEKIVPVESGMKVLGNPARDELLLQFNASESDDYRLVVSDVSGRSLYSNDVKILKGENKIKVSGLGNSGVKIVGLSNGEESYGAKVVLTESSNYAPNMNVLSAGSLEHILKNAQFEADSVILRFDPVEDNYLGFDKTLFADSQVFNYVLEQLPYVFTTTLKPFLETGEPVTNVAPGFTVTFEFAQPTGVKVYSPDENGEINIEENLFPLGETLGTAIMYHDTSTYVVDGVSNHLLNWIILRQPNQKTNRPNVAQSPSVDFIPERTMPVVIDSLDGKVIHYYTSRKRAETQEGEYFDLDSPGSIGLIASSGGGFWASTFIDLAPYGVADSLDIVKLDFNLSSGQPNPPEQQERLDNLLQLALETRYLPNGDTLLSPHRVYTISSFSDPRWLALIERNYENLSYMAFHDETPGNVRFWSSDYTYNGHLRLQKTSGKANIYNGNGTIFTEIFSAVTGEEEGAGGLAPYIWNATLDAPSQFAYCISALPALLELGTGQNVTSQVPKEMYSLTKKGDVDVVYSEGVPTFAEDCDVAYDYIKK